MLIGSHISIRGGYLQAAKTALAIGAGCFQYFPKNPRSLKVKVFDRSDAEACAAFCRKHGLVSVAHTPYPVNLAVEPSDLQKATVASLKNDLEIAEACGSTGIIAHFGKWREKDPLQGYKNIIQCLNEALFGWDGQTLLLLENQAGEGGPMGTTLEELVNIRRLCAYPEKIGFCLDTCHLFASGVWNGGNWRELAAKGRSLDYFAHLKAVHLNDSEYPSGSFRDRHANIGYGQIGVEAIKEFLATPELHTLPAVLETEPGPDRTHRAEIAYVNGLAR